MALRATPPWLKIVIEIDRGEEIVKSQVKRKRKANKKFKEDDSDFDSGSDDDN